ncbi:uncharacterized protein RHIMIDRAFT_238806 [Rhizopus microsporus ATCC 52813]|uniref:Uncharacterized protein n=1 Tax=Rhizopus microsporus ATCC 52813 TaxID=1340429 RepID=A0A2G4SRK0_RHIZD|nr:uncharacterized protein RHIMIDRAFT_238806 [Rhizopus microsporus ATCC 52813]PHZ11372.1 hypothetical protein RHIMIDRAFT_238806 [Rhizopus microsporus ATCC 52813]
MSNMEENAIRSTFPSVNIQWRLFHVLTAMSQQVRAKLVLESLPDSKRAHQPAILQLKGMMWRTAKLNIPESSAYTQHSCSISRTTIWITADSLSGQEHSQLKTSYLQRGRNRRVDRLVYILVNDVEEDFLSNINRIRMNVVRIGPEAREARRRELEAEEASIHVAMDMNSEVERTSLYNIQSFNNADETYEVRVENDTHMFFLGCCTEYDVWRGPSYTEVSSIEGLQPEPEPELLREQENTVQKLKMLKEVVENLSPDEVTSSWKLQVAQIYKEVVLRSNQVEELPSNIHLERQKIN